MLSLVFICTSFILFLVIQKTLVNLCYSATAVLALWHRLVLERAKSKCTEESAEGCSPVCLETSAMLTD